MVFNQYASFYDIFYQGKNYKKECNSLEQLFVRHMKGRPKTILDLGCGTGGHMLPLTQRGYAVTGVDASLKMLSLAREKFAKKNLKAEFLRSRIQFFKVAKKFDAIVCMFSVVDYLTRDKDLRKTFRNVAAHMKKTSIFIFDFWRAEAVEKYFLPEKNKAFRSRDGIVERHSSTKINQKKHLCEVNYKIQVQGNGDPRRSFQEKHVLRYFSIDEIRNFLQKAGLNILGLHPFSNINGTIRNNTWDVTVVAGKR